MNGLMMQQPLLISSLLVHAERHHGDQEVVSRRVEGDIHRTTYREMAVRSRRMAKAIAALGIASGQRVATLAWNGYRHMELYYAVSGSGAVLHTLNPRLHPDQVVWIADHAEDQDNRIEQAHLAGGGKDDYACQHHHAEHGQREIERTVQVVEQCARLA